MMGLSNGVHWVAWFLNSFALMFITILFMLAVLKVSAVVIMLFHEDVCVVSHYTTFVSSGRGHHAI